MHVCFSVAFVVGIVFFFVVVVGLVGWVFLVGFFVLEMIKKSLPEMHRGFAGHNTLLVCLNLHTHSLL